MVSEFNFEKDFVVKYFRDELKYDQEDSNQFNSELMLLPSVVERFIISNNEQLCKEIIRNDFQGDKKEFFQKITEEFSKFLYSSYNVAIQLHPKKHSGFKFLGKYLFNLYLPFNNIEEDKNIYTVVQQVVFKIKTSTGILYIKPDVAVFINGFLVSYLQLKLQHKGQSAKEEGRGQIIGDYLETVKVGVANLYNKFQSDDDKNNIINNSMKYFHSPIHLVAMDSSSAYILRGIGRYFSDVEKLSIENKADDSGIKKEILKAFFIDSLFNKEPNLPSDEQCKKVLFNLYDKSRLQNEILYFNFKSYERCSEYYGSQKVVEYKTRSPVWFFPRPNQKYGVEKTITEVIKKYRNEDNSNYEVERLASRLDELQVPEAQKQRALERRMSYKNNTNQFSMLLQYAAGFGKTYILCWLALMLKDLTNPKENNKKDYLFDKILLISDRIDLRDQVEVAMHNMNIEKSLFAEARTKETLIKFLTSDTPRIIIVNIQKFPFLNELLGEDEMSLLKDKRIAFLIDEIHRSNAGTQHHSMTSLFDEVVNSFISQTKKKNLIIGLTATPTDENLDRFGEYQGCLEDIKWVPFDAYTMNEAIEDGFVLDPTKALIPCAIKLQYAEEEGKSLPLKKDIYENEERLRATSKKIAEILVSTTYKKIYGYGKAMLACSSIDAAKKYVDFINEELEIITKKTKYAKYTDTKIYVVFTHNQEDRPAHDLCGFSSEKEVIAAFRADKNGLMIVVDKLQTGFDEPKLHTLFLDKEVNGIGAVQTVCRVNRTTKNKEDCLVVDFSKDNINISNIKNAFEKYAGVVVSDFDRFSFKVEVEDYYRKITNTEIYTLNFAEYIKNMNGVEYLFNLQNYVKNMLNDGNGKKLLIKDCDLFLSYIKKIGLIINVVELSDKYKDPILLGFLRDCINLIKGKTADVVSHEIVDFWFENIGIVESDQVFIDEMKKRKINDDSLKTKEHKDNKFSEYNIIKLIIEANLKEEGKEILIENFIEKLHILFEKILEIDASKYDGRMILKLQNIDAYTDREITEDFNKVFNMTVRRLKNDKNMSGFISEISDNVSLMEGDFINFMLKK